MWGTLCPRARLDRSLQTIAELDVDILQIMFVRALNVDMHEGSGCLNHLLARLKRLNTFPINQGARGSLG
jgi:hypothetical protein